MLAYLIQVAFLITLSGLMDHLAADMTMKIAVVIIKVRKKLKMTKKKMKMKNLQKSLRNFLCYSRQLQYC